MSISGDDVRHIAALARVGVDASRIPSLVTELNGILAHMDVLQRVQLPDNIHDDITAMPLRADVPSATALERPREQFAPATRDGFFLVPRLSTHQAAGAAADEDDA
jgi:aspartyl-tRNA(Asn)/glutamyl-tRNA(Gln) amidotransferase subunit C